MSDGSTPRDRANIVALPPLIFLAGLVVGFVIESRVATSLGAREWWRAAGVTAVAVGAALGIWGDLAMKRAGTSPFPWKPTQVIVDQGPYAWSRNPLYVAQALIHAGIAALGDSWWAMAMLLPVLVVVRYGVIGPEEEYLTRKFGDPYLQYLQRVRRWL